MKLNDLVNLTDLNAAIEQRLINVRPSVDQMFIYNYTDAALYTPGAWDNPAVRQCRGLIVRQDGTVVARPWSKFFNHGQQEAGVLDLDALVEVTDKMDGSLGIIHRDNLGFLRVATRGSFESEQALHATTWLRQHVAALAHLDTVTPLVEIIYPDNRIVCDYGDRDELVLLGAVVIETGEYLGPYAAAELIGWVDETTTVFSYPSLRDALAAAPRAGAEGLCVRYVHASRIVKIKQEDYVRLHRIVSGLSERSVWQHMVEHGVDALPSLLEPLPDELHQWAINVWDDIARKAEDISFRANYARHKIARDGHGGTRKEFAEHAKEWIGLTPFIFLILDGRDPMPQILKTLKPEGHNPAKHLTEAVA